MFLIVCIILFASPAYYTAAPLYTSITDNVVNCSEHGDCLTVSTDCTKQCGCDNTYYYDEIEQECRLNIEYLKTIIVEKYNTPEKIRRSAEKVFQGIIVSVILFVACASTCALTACIYCFRINYTDQKLQGDVKALTAKLHREGKLNKSQKTQQKPSDIAESCNIVDVDGGVFVC